MKVVPYAPQYKQDFIDLNIAWISAMFQIESEDLRELNNIDAYLDNGGQIFFALDDDETVLACCMIAPRDDGDWEIMKFAARGMSTGTGAGSAWLEACIDYAHRQHVRRIIIVSNTKCLAALHLYRKYGFAEIPVDKEKLSFERGDIAFAMSL